MQVVLVVGAACAEVLGILVECIDVRVAVDDDVVHRAPHVAYCPEGIRVGVAAGIAELEGIALVIGTARRHVVVTTHPDHGIGPVDALCAQGGIGTRGSLVHGARIGVVDGIHVDSVLRINVDVVGAAGQCQHCSREYI